MRKIKIHPDHMNAPQVQLDRCESLEEAKAVIEKSSSWFHGEVCEAYNAVTGDFLGYYAVAWAKEYDERFSKPARK